jgi:hypothetical protein
VQLCDHCDHYCFSEVSIYLVFDFYENSCDHLEEVSHHAFHIQLLELAAIFKTTQNKLIYCYIFTIQCSLTFRSIRWLKRGIFLEFKKPPKHLNRKINLLPPTLFQSPRNILKTKIRNFPVKFDIG